MGASADPAANNSINKLAGPVGWAVAIITGVVFIGLLYNGASHGEGGDHGADHGAEHDAAPAKEPAAH